MAILAQKLVHVYILANGSVSTNRNPDKYFILQDTHCKYPSKPTVIVVLLLSKLHIVGFHQISIFHLYCDKIHYWSNTFVLFRVYVISDPDRNLMGKTSKGSVK